MENFTILLQSLPEFIRVIIIFIIIIAVCIITVFIFLILKDVVKLLARNSINIGKNGVTFNSQILKKINGLNKCFELGKLYSKNNCFDREALAIMEQGSIIIIKIIMDKYKQIYRTVYKKSNNITKLDCYNRYYVMTCYILKLLEHDALYAIALPLKNNLNSTYSGFKVQTVKMLIGKSFDYFDLLYFDDKIIKRELIFAEHQYIIEEIINELYNVVDRLKNMVIKKENAKKEILNKKEAILKE